MFGNWLLKRVSSAVVQTSGYGNTVLKHLPWTSINGSATGPNSEFMLGCYDRNNTILLVNQDSNHPALATVVMSSLASGQNKMMELDPKSGSLIAFQGRFAIFEWVSRLLAGDARLFTWTT